MRRGYDDPYWLTPEGLRDQAREHATGNYRRGDIGWCDPDEAEWTLELLTAADLTHAFSSAEEARAWIDSEIRAAEDDGLSRDWHLLLSEEIREEVIVMIHDGVAYIWDGWHRIAASIAKGAPIKAIVGRRKATHLADA